MNGKNWTAGPWACLPEECDKPYIRIRGTRLGGRYKIANVLTPVYEGVHEREAKETRANSALICSAPDLYDVLAEIINDGGKFVMTHETHRKARAALAKARGESQ